MINNLKKYMAKKKEVAKKVTKKTPKKEQTYFVYIPGITTLEDICIAKKVDFVPGVTTVEDVCVALKVDVVYTIEELVGLL